MKGVEAESAASIMTLKTVSAVARNLVIMEWTVATFPTVSIIQKERKVKAHM